MKKYLQSFFISALFLTIASSISVVAQDRSDDFPNSLGIKEIIKKLESQNLLPANDLEFTVVGEVQIPGIIKLKRNPTLRDVIAYVGGLTKDADRSIRIIRKDLKFGYIIEFFVNIREISSVEKNPLVDGDIIVVPKAKNIPVEKLRKIDEINPFPKRFPMDFRHKNLLPEIV